MAQENQREKLKQLFAKRVTTQARVVLDVYQKCKLGAWEELERVRDLNDASEKLERFATRFEMSRQETAARKINQLLSAVNPNAALSLDSQQKVESFIQELNECTLRKSDTSTNASEPSSSNPRTFLRTPVYLALNNNEYATRIINQLEFFGFRSINFQDVEEFHTCSQTRQA